jgi:hypothetical protein
VRRKAGAANAAPASPRIQSFLNVFRSDSRNTSRVACFAAVITAAALTVPLHPALAECTTAGGNYSAITQNGGSANASLDQSGAANGAACITQSGQSAIAEMLQIDSAGAANVATIVQANGLNQSASVQQNGNGNFAAVGQSQAQGAVTANFTAVLNQWAGNGANEGDDGRAKDANIYVADPSHGAVIVQTGNGNNASVGQGVGSDGSYAQILQFGSNNTGAISQTNMINALAGSNFASIFQTDSFNSASISQNGSSLIGTIEQTGSGHSASLTQTGQNLEYHIEQSGTQTLGWGSNGGPPNGGLMVNSTLPGISVTQTSGVGVTIILQH